MGTLLQQGVSLIIYLFIYLFRFDKLLWFLFLFFFRLKELVRFLLIVYRLEKCHYENMPIQIYWKFYHQKMKISDKNSDIFRIPAQNIDCGYSLEPPLWGGSNEYSQDVFWAEIRKIMYTPVNPSFTI